MLSPGFPAVEKRQSARQKEQPELAFDKVQDSRDRGIQDEKIQLDERLHDHFVETDFPRWYERLRAWIR